MLNLHKIFTKIISASGTKTLSRQETKILEKYENFKPAPKLNGYRNVSYADFFDSEQR